VRASELRTPSHGLRAGFALALALFALVVLTLLVGLLFDAGVQEVRMARGQVASARAQAAAESAFADLLDSRPDSGLVLATRGTARQSTWAGPEDTALVVLQALGTATVRVVITAHAWSGAIRADAGAVAFLRVLRDSAGPPGTLRFQRLPGWWWAPIP
jgi:Tfp pilus assembly protein PilX